MKPEKTQSGLGEDAKKCARVRKIQQPGADCAARPDGFPTAAGNFTSQWSGMQLAVACLHTLFIRKGPHMFGPAAAYVVAFSAMLFSGISALTLIYTVRHLDEPEVGSTPAHDHQDVAA